MAIMLMFVMCSEWAGAVQRSVAVGSQGGQEEDDAAAANSGAAAGNVD